MTSRRRLLQALGLGAGTLALAEARAIAARSPCPPRAVPPTRRSGGLAGIGGRALRLADGRIGATIDRVEKSPDPPSHDEKR